MTRMVLFMAGWIALTSVAALGQKSSIGAKTREAQQGKPAPKQPREAPERPRNPVYEQHSWITLAPPPPKTYEPGDLLTIIIRERKRWEAESDLNTKKRWNLSSDVSAFMKFIDGGVGSSNFTRGEPNIKYKFENQMRSDGDSSREDSLTTRLTARIIDVKPNGTLVIEGRARLIHDDEVSDVTVTGSCRKEDVTADNTLLSTQLADKTVVINNEGALRRAASRGWIPTLIDLLKPF